MGICLLALSAGTMLAFFFAASLQERVGLRKLCQLSVTGWAFLFVLPGLAGSAKALFVALFICGIAVGLCEVAMNAAADRIERDGTRRIMSRCHGFWSLGSLFGALAGTVFAWLEVSVAVHFLIVMPLLAMLGLISSSALPAMADARTAVDSGQAVRANTAAKETVFRWPHRGILLLCFDATWHNVCRGRIHRLVSRFYAQRTAGGPHHDRYYLCFFSLW